MLTNTKSPVTHSVYCAHLKEKISAFQKQILENINTANASIIHRTQAINAKRPYHTILGACTSVAIVNLTQYLIIALLRY
jgi:hypothetical protein